MNSSPLVAIPAGIFGIVLLVLGAIYALSPIIIVMQLSRIQRLMEKQIAALEDLKRGEKPEAASSVRYRS